jgi:hypothetical protein
VGCPDNGRREGAVWWRVGGGQICRDQLSCNGFGWLVTCTAVTVLEPEVPRISDDPHQFASPRQAAFNLAPVIGGREIAAGFYATPSKRSFMVRARGSAAVT